MRDHTKYGCLDTLGKVKIPFKYYDIVPFHDGYAMARIKKDFFVIDTQGNETRVNDPTVIDVHRFQENLAPFLATNEKMGFVNTNGKIVIPAQFDHVRFFSNGLAWARNDDELIGYINPNEIIIICVCPVASNFHYSARSIIFQITLLQRPC